MVAPIDPDVVALQARIFAERLRLPEVLKGAKVNRSTWFRWCRGDSEPNKRTLRRIGEAIDKKLAERSAPPEVI